MFQGFWFPVNIILISGAPRREISFSWFSGVAQLLSLSGRGVPTARRLLRTPLFLSLSRTEP